MNYNFETEKIRYLAHQYWNFDKIPPKEYREAVAQYIYEHIEEFRGAGPQ